MFVAMNQFQVAKDREGDFEQIWKGRESYLRDIPGFVQFALLRSDSAGEYISHSVWRDRDAFRAWTESEAFVKGHAQASLAGVLEGPPQLRLFRAVIVEDAGGRTVDKSEPERDRVMRRLGH